MSKTQVLCARCFKAPEAPRTYFDTQIGREDGGWDHYCSQECVNLHHLESWEPVNETARLAVALVNADLMMHMLLACGREDDDSMALVQARRVALATRIQELAKLDEVKEVLK